MQSGFWHQFALTAHSPVGLKPELYGVVPKLKEITFANNDIDFEDKTKIDHNQFSKGLKKSLYNYMHDIGFDLQLQEWFEFEIPTTTIKPNFIEQSLNFTNQLSIKPTAKVVWLGNEPAYKLVTKTKKGETWNNLQLIFHSKVDILKIVIPEKEGKWLVDEMKIMSILNPKTITYQQLKESFETELANFELFWYSKPIQKLKNNGLISL